MLRHVERVKAIVEAKGIKFVTLRSEKNFEYLLTEQEVPNRKPGSDLVGVPGYGWPTAKTRWCTKLLKTSLIENHLRAIREEYNVIQYKGIAADEDYRMAREQNQNPNHRHPLRDWGWTEADALAYCRKLGFDWEGLYDIFKRVSCWCCPLKQYDELRKTRTYYPDLWAQLLELDARQGKTFAHGYSVADFDQRFALEDALTAAGHSIKNRKFFADLKLLLAGEATVDSILAGRQSE